MHADGEGRVDAWLRGMEAESMMPLGTLSEASEIEIVSCDANEPGSIGGGDGATLDADPTAAAREHLHALDSSATDAAQELVRESEARAAAAAVAHQEQLAAMQRQIDELRTVTRESTRRAVPPTPSVPLLQR